MAKEQPMVDGAGAADKKKRRRQQQQNEEEEPSSAFSESELDVARQLVQLSGNSDESTAACSSTAAVRRVLDDGTEASSVLRKFGPSVESSNDHSNSNKRKKKFRSLRNIYESTDPLSSDVGLARKMRCRNDKETRTYRLTELVPAIPKRGHFSRSHQHNRLSPSHPQEKSRSPWTQIQLADCGLGCGQPIPKVQCKSAVFSLAMIRDSIYNTLATAFKYVEVRIQRFFTIVTSADKMCGRKKLSSIAAAGAKDLRRSHWPGGWK
ncbi:hypothetical protein CRG98_026562 [Punica granatum]|uniref:Uncharacterized protein n=1 Tax=Punica granatum TaxID=22663 RepID=A0A2I0J9P9_PUNGR|nr:hypothetical protein CRG98_026562 [Punica granatum]